MSTVGYLGLLKNILIFSALDHHVGRRRRLIFNASNVEMILDPRLSCLHPYPSYHHGSAHVFSCTFGSFWPCMFFSLRQPEVVRDH